MDLRWAVFTSMSKLYKISLFYSVYGLQKQTNNPSRNKISKNSNKRFIKKERERYLRIARTIKINKKETRIVVSFANETPLCATTCTKKMWLPDGEKKKEIWPSPMTKPPIPTENSKTKGQHTNATKNFDYTTIADRLRTVSWSNKSSNWCG